MSPVRIRKRTSRGLPRKHYGVKPVSLPTFGCYDYLPVVYADGELVIGGHAMPLERRP